MGAPPRQRIPVVTRTSIITSTAAAAQSQPPPPPPAFSMIFPLPEEISQLSDEFMPSSSENATSPAFRTLNNHHQQHQLRQNDGANHNQTEAPPSSLSSPKQVSLEILPGSCLSHHDLGGFFITAAATSASEMSNTETLSERCLSLDDLRTSSSASSNGIGFQPGATMTAGSSNAVVRAASAAATYSLHPLGGVQSSYVHHQLGACKKVILEERPITPHSTGHHNTDSKVYLRL
jgi:hypothetical protein